MTQQLDHVDELLLKEVIKQKSKYIKLVEFKRLLYWSSTTLTFYAVPTNFQKSIWNKYQFSLHHHNYCHPLITPSDLISSRCFVEIAIPTKRNPRKIQPSISLYLYFLISATWKIYDFIVSNFLYYTFYGF